MYSDAIPYPSRRSAMPDGAHSCYSCHNASEGDTSSGASMGECALNHTNGLKRVAEMGNSTWRFESQSM